MRTAVLVGAAVLTLLYPVAVYLSLGRLSPAWLGGALVVLGALRLLLARRPRSAVDVSTGVVMAAFGVGLALRGEAGAMRWYPVLVNATLLAVFGASLRWPPPVIERLARLTRPDLPESGVRYTRRVTQVWCGFFLLNGLVAAGTALWASLATWTLYNGLISYVLMGLLFGGEYLVRLRHQRAEAAAR